MLILAMGESLAVGAATNTTGFPATYPPSGGMYALNDAGQWRVLTEPVEAPGASPIWTNIQDADPGYGYMGLLAWRLWKHFGRLVNVGVVPCGKSGTTSWDWSTSSGLYTDTLAKAQVARRAPGTVALVVIDQGVNDCGATSDPGGQTWTQRWLAVLNGLLAAGIITASTPILVRRLPATVSSTYDATKWGNLRTEQSAFPGAATGFTNVTVVEGLDANFISAGNPHYNATGNERFSRRQYEAAKPLLTTFAASLSGRRGFTTWPSGTTVFGTPTDYGTYGSGTGGAALVLLRKNSTGAGVQILAAQVNGNNGFTLRSNGSTLQAILGVSTTSVTAPTRTWVAGDNSKIHLICMTWDATNLYLYFDRAQVGTSTSLGGATYSAATSRSLCIFSNDAGTSMNTDSTFLDAAVSNSFLSLADYQTICDQTKTAGYLTPGAISLGHTWQFPLESSAPDYVADSATTHHDLEFIQGDERNLTHTSIDLTTATWGW